MIAIAAAQRTAPARNARCAIFSGEPGAANSVADFANYSAPGQRFLGAAAFAALVDARANISGGSAPPAPEQVTGLAAAAASFTAMALTWNAVAAPPLDYVVQFRASPNGAWSVFKNAPSAARSRTITSLTSASAYDFRVAAVNASALGPWSSILTAATPGLITQRNPAATDDAGKGYAIDSSWLNASTGALFKAAAVTPGAAVWSPLSDRRGPLCDQIAAAPFVACGIKKFVAAYNGPCLRLKRASDNAEIDIGFTEAGLIDAAAADAFAGASTANVVKWYDQSGDSKHMISGAFAPLWTQNTSNGSRSITFTNIEDTATTPSLELPASVALDRGAHAAVMILQSASPAQANSAYAIIGSDPDYTKDKLIFSSNGALLQGYPGTVHSAVNATPSFLCISSGPGAEMATVNEVTTSGPAQTSFATSGGVIGKFSTSQNLFADYLGFESTVSEHQGAAERRYLLRNHKSAERRGRSRD